MFIELKPNNTFHVQETKKKKRLEAIWELCIDIIEGWIKIKGQKVVLAIQNKYLIEKYRYISSLIII